MSPADTNTYIQGFIELDRQRHTQRWKLAMTYAGIVILLLFGTGTVSLINTHEAPAPSTRVVVDLADCPPLGPDLLPIVTFTITMRGDGTPELQGCQRWKERPQRRSR